MTYEQKAKEIVSAMTQGEGVGPIQAESLITTALREAGNAKLEEAAAVVDQHAGKAVSESEDNAVMALVFAAVEIRSLIQKD